MELRPGEQKLFEGHPSWRSILAYYLKTIGLSVLAAGLVYGVTDLIGDAATGVAVVVLLVGVGVALLVGFVKRISTTYTITNRRLHIKRGVISREVQETRLGRVQNVTYSQSILERMLQVGSVDFDTAAQDDYEFRFVGVADPPAVVRQVDTAIAEADPEGLGGTGEN